MDSIVTKKGDAGTTGLLYGGRVRKDDVRTEAYGALDEAVSALGLARSLADPPLAATIARLQNELFMAGAELATDPKKRAAFLKHFKPVGDGQIGRIEDDIRALEAAGATPQGFILPGGTPPAAALDLARAMIRRVERWTVKLESSGKLSNPALLPYFNRVSDYLFLLARSAEGPHRMDVRSQRQ